MASGGSSVERGSPSALGDMFRPPPTAPHEAKVHQADDTKVDTMPTTVDGNGQPRREHNLSASRSFAGELIVVGGKATTSALHTQHSLPNPRWVPPADPHRAVHRIRLSALQHNFYQVQAAASRQRCSVVVVVKADGYGHGAITTALQLADTCGADTFAVATLEEGVALRRALAANPPGRWSQEMASLFHTQHHAETTQTSNGYATAAVPNDASHASNGRPTMRPAQIRILVLGPPVGFPRCFDDYYHHGIEVMVSGQEVAASLLHWVADEGQRKRIAVERAAREAQSAALNTAHVREEAPAPAAVELAPKKEVDSSVGSTSTVASPNTSTIGSSEKLEGNPANKKILPHHSSTLGNVQGVDLAREVRSLLINQREAKIRQQHVPSASTSMANSAVTSEAGSLDSDSEEAAKTATTAGERTNEKAAFVVFAPVASGTVFGGIEAAARSSRNQEATAARARAVLNEDDDDEEDEEEWQRPPTPPVAKFSTPTTARKRLRWYALVDSGMGRLGFRTEIVKADDKTGRRDTVDVLKEMVGLELEGNAPLEFYGMCTHMADARDLSDYTNSQISKFATLLKRVRAAGISVPTVSTDNSAALLTTSLKHFDPIQMLSQPGADTRGYVRTGGAIYGQRPAFKQLRAVSTLLASVRHVAVRRKGDSVGYDRAYVAPYDVRIATLTIGFADGYPRELGNGVGKVEIRGTVFPIAGNVCMDMIMVELGPANEKEGIGASVVVGDTAVLWGPLDEDCEDEGMVRLQDVAAALKTTQSALTCGLDKIRVRRQFV